MAEKFINIDFPFRDDNKGKLLNMNNVNERAIKADLLHLLLTNEGERLYRPSFGANLRKFIFEPNLGDVHNKIKEEIQNKVRIFIPFLQIDDVTLTPGEEGQTRNEHHVLVKIDYTVNNGAFASSDFVEIEL